MEEIEFSRWLFEGRPRQGKNVRPDGLNWQCYFAGSSKSHHENSISFIFLEYPHQVDMKNVVKCQKEFIAYFNALETTCEYVYFNINGNKYNAKEIGVWFNQLSPVFILAFLAFRRAGLSITIKRKMTGFYFGVFWLSDAQVFLLL